MRDPRGEASLPGPPPRGRRDRSRSPRRGYDEGRGRGGDRDWGRRDFDSRDRRRRDDRRDGREGRSDGRDRERRGREDREADEAEKFLQEVATDISRGDHGSRGGVDPARPPANAWDRANGHPGPRPSGASWSDRNANQGPGAHPVHGIPHGEGAYDPAAAMGADGMEEDDDVPPPPPPPPEDEEEDNLEVDEAALAEQQMMAMMGFTAAFGTSKGKEHDDAGEVKLKSTRVYRQYMNRKGGFNRPLPKEKTGQQLSKKQLQ